MKNGEGFEKLTELIFSRLVNNPEYESVSHNIKLEGEDGKRQIDVLLTSKITAGIEIKTIIECKDYKNKVSIGVIDKLHSVMQDVNANKGIVVSVKGFSSKAISKAKRLGISLYTAHEALSDKWAIDIEVPIIVTEIMPKNFNPRFNVVLKQGDSFQNEAVFTVNDINIHDEFLKYWSGGRYDIKSILPEDEHDFLPSGLKSPFFIRNVSGEKVEIVNLRIHTK